MGELPARIGRYEVQSVLGRGAMGVIYKAHDPAIDRAVAIKLVRADLLSGEDRDQYLERFRHEARAAGRCTHPNIVAVYDFAVHEGNPFIAMEFVQGISLSEALARGARFKVDEAVYIVRQVLEALACAHALGVVHRDVKPANILLLAGGRVKVTDFGISRIEASHLTQTGSVVGTPSYMSPEQCRAEPVDARSDVFSAGAVLYEVLSGARPFAGRSFSQVMHQVLNESPPDIREKIPALPSGVESVLARALQKRPEDRFPSAQAMADALRDSLRPGAATAPAEDRTVLLPPQPAAPTESGIGIREEAGGARFDPGVLDSIERRLARHVGPIAKRLVRTASRAAPSVESLCETLSLSIEEPAERSAFLNDAAGLLRSPSGSGVTRTTIAFANNPAISSDQAERVTRDLARFMGPIARVLVKRAVGSARSTQDLREKLAAHIEKPSDRATFLKDA